MLKNSSKLKRRMTYIITQNSITAMVNGKPLWKATVKNPMEGIKYARVGGKENPDRFIQSQREYHGFSE